MSGLSSSRPARPVGDFLPVDVGCSGFVGACGAGAGVGCEPWCAGAASDELHEGWLAELVWPSPLPVL